MRLWGKTRGLLELALLLVVFSGKIASAADWSLVPNVQLKSEFNSNLNYDSQNSMNDFIFSLLPTADFNYTTDIGLLQGRLGWTAWHYLSHRNLDTIDQNYQINGFYQALPRLKLNLGTAYIVDSSLKQELLTSGLVMSRTPRQSITVSPGMTYSVTERLQATCSYSLNAVTYQAPQYRNFKTHQFMLRLDFPLKNERTVISDTYQIGETLYAGGDTMTIFTSTMGVNHKFSETWEANLSGGLNYSKSESSTQVLDTTAFPFFIRFKTQKQTQTNQTANLAVSTTKKWSRASLTGSFSRNLAPAASGTTYETNQLSASFVYQLTERMSFTLPGSYSLSNAISKTSKSEPTFFGTSPQLSYQITEKLSLAQSYSFGYRGDLAGGSNAKAHGIWLTLTYTYPIHYQK